MSLYEPKPPPAYDTAPRISVVEGEVVLLGPGSIAFSMTRAAAEETHRRLGAALENVGDALPDRGDRQG